MQSNERMLAVLDLFDLDHPEWRFEDIAARLNCGRSTLYRYIKLLTDAGFLAPAGDSSYRLGPRIIEMDHQIRVTDPLIRRAKPLMSEIVRDEAGICLLCRRYRDRVLCVHEESSTTRFLSNYERGRARPLLRGAASLAILMHFPAHRLSRLFNRMPDEFARAGLGETLPDLRARLRAMRQGGWVVTESQVTEGVTGVAAPVFGADGEILASLSITLPETGVSPARLQAVGKRILFCARVVTAASHQGDAEEK